MAQSVIKSVIPQMFNGVQQSWQNKFTGKPNYGFTILFEDGISGGCASERNVYPLQPGTEVTYELSGTNGSNHITKVKKVEPVAGNPGYGNGNGKSYNDPGTVKRIAFLMDSLFSEFVGFFDQITSEHAVVAKVEEKVSNDKASPKIDLSPVTGKITAIRVSKSLIRHLI